MEGASGVLINITGGPDLTLHRGQRGLDHHPGGAHEDANIIFGAVIDRR